MIWYLVLFIVAVVLIVALLVAIGRRNKRADLDDPENCFIVPKGDDGAGRITSVTGGRGSGTRP
jgi:hypothetical protein